MPRLNPESVETVTVNEEWQTRDNPGTEFQVRTYGCGCCSRKEAVPVAFGIECLDSLISRLESELTKYKAMRSRYHA